MLRKVPDLFVAPSSMTTASLIDTIALAKRQITVLGHNPPCVEFNSVQTVASELGVFLPAYDPAFMNTLTKLYDGEYYEERRRTGKVNHLVLERPLLSIFGGCTPNYLSSFLPEGAWEQGFTSRTILVFSNEKQRKSIWGEGIDQAEITKLETDLVEDLKSISHLYGMFKWSEDCMAAVSAWDDKDLAPVPEHAKLAHYNTRRLAHLIKLCMTANVARTNDMFITLSDFLIAKKWLLDAEADMPSIFNLMGSSIDAKTIDDAVYYLREAQKRDGGRPVNEHLLYGFLRNKMPIANIQRTIEVMEKSKDIRRIFNNGRWSVVPTRE
jgi:hypothetical protein